MTGLENLENQRALEHAIAQQRLEGLYVTPDALRDLRRVARGKMTIAEALQATYARYARKP